jgi:lysophospholipase L1-like esterase
MNPIVHHIINGDAFFAGTGALILACAAGAWARGRLGMICLRLLIIAGGLLVFLSVTPLSFWFYGLWGISVLWLLVECSRKTAARRIIAARIMVAVLSLTAIAMEFPFHRTPTISTAGINCLLIVGDSVSAGDGRGTKTWPILLSKRLQMNLVDQSRNGQTVETAIDHARRLKGNDPEKTLAILEIGGNDLLGYTENARFDEQLDQLLRIISSQSHRIVMLELPLPPLYNQFGMAQRKLARRYRVTLVPKRYFARIFAAPEATFDGLHPTQIGHDRIAAMLETILDRSRGNLGACCSNGGPRSVVAATGRFPYAVATTERGPPTIEPAVRATCPKRELCVIRSQDGFRQR